MQRHTTSRQFSTGEEYFRYYLALISTISLLWRGDQATWIGHFIAISFFLLICSYKKTNASIFLIASVVLLFLSELILLAIFSNILPPVFIRLYISEVSGELSLLFALWWIFLVLQRYIYISRLLEISLLSYSFHQLVRVYEHHPTRPYLLIDWSIEHQVDPTLMLSLISALVLVLWALRGSRKEIFSYSGFITIFFTLLLSLTGPISYLLPELTETIPPKPSPPSSSPSTPPPSPSPSTSPPKPRVLSLMRIYGELAEERRLKAIFLSEMTCTERDLLEPEQERIGAAQQQNIRCSVPVAIDPTQAKNSKFKWERFDLTQEVNSAEWILSTQRKRSTSMSFSSHKIIRAHTGFADSFQMDLRSSPNRQLLTISALQKANLIFESPENTNLETAEIPDELKHLIRPLLMQALEPLDEFERTLDSAILTAVLALFDQWKLENDEQTSLAHPFTPHTCLELRGSGASRLRCAYLVLRAHGFAIRVQQGYRLPVSQSDGLRELLVSTAHAQPWLEIFVAEPSGEIVGWRPLSLGGAQQSEAPPIEEHEQKQLISHWIDEARDASSTPALSERSGRLIFSVLLCVSLLLLLIDRAAVWIRLRLGGARVIYEITLVHLAYLGLRRKYGEPRSSFCSRVGASVGEDAERVLRLLTDSYESNRNDLDLMRKLSKQLIGIVQRKLFSDPVLSSQHAQFQFQCWSLNQIDSPRGQDK